MPENTALTDGDFDDESEEFAHAVKWCLAHRESLNQTLRTLRESHLRGEFVQRELSKVLDRCPNLRRVCYVAWRFNIEAAIDAAIAQDQIEEEAGRRFIMWWGEQQWITDGLEAYINSNSGTQNSPWTQTTLRFRLDGDQLLVEHKMDRGVDELHNVCVPAEKLLDEAIWQTAGVIEKLTEAIEANDLDPDHELLEHLQEKRDTLTEVTAQIESLEDSIDVSNEPSQSAADTDTSPSDDFEALFDNPESDSPRDRDEDSMRGFY